MRRPVVCDRLGLPGKEPSRGRATTPQWFDVVRHYCILAAFDRRNDHWRKFGPVEVFRDLTNVRSPALADVTLIARINDEILDLNPQQLRCWTRFEFGFGLLKMVARYRTERRKFLSPERDCSGEIVS